MKASPRARAHNDTKAAQNRIEILEQGFDRHALALAEAYDDLEAARAVEEDVIENRRYDDRIDAFLYAHRL